MGKHIAYFSTGEVISCECGKATWKRRVQLFTDKGERVWFRDCSALREAVRKSNDQWARSMGLANYEAYLFIQDIIKGK